MRTFLACGMQKPPVGAVVNPEHPFGQNIVCMLPAWESLLQTSTVPEVRLADQRVTLSRAGTITPTSNRGGNCLNFASGQVLMAGTNWLPTTNCTVVCVVRHTSTQFQRIVAATAGGQLDLYLPYVDNVVYWDFGGQVSPNRLTVSGLTFSTTLLTTYVATAGRLGSTIWQNGVKVASQSTAVTRTGASETLYIDRDGVSAGDINYLAVYNAQWSDELCRWWSAEPYAHFYPPRSKRLRSFVLWSLLPGQRALMYALGHVARGGATRGQYHDARVYVAIDGTHYATARASDTTRILDGSLTITDVIDETPNTCRFQTKGFVPTEGQSVVITLGSKNNGKREFGGQILSTKRSYTDTPANVEVEVNAIDPTWTLDRRKVTKAYRNQSGAAIAGDLIASFTTGITADHVATNLDTLDEITFTNQDPSAALTQLAKRLGGYWYIDYFGDLHLFVDEEVLLTNPTTLTPSHPTLTDVQVTRDLSQFVTRVFYEGGGVNALTDLAAGETILPVDDAVWYETGGGTVTTGQQRITYSSTETGGAGSLIGPGVGPASAPVVVAAVGSGVTAGDHGYAVTFITGSGETLPSPEATLTVGGLAAPSAPTLALGEYAGGGVEAGVHEYAATFVTAAGETTSGAIATVTHGTYTVTDPVWTGTGVYNNTSGGSLTANQYYGYVATYVTSGGETLASNRSVCYADGFNHTLTVFNIPVSPFNAVTARKLYRTTGNAWTGTLYLVATISDNVTTSYIDTASDASIASHANPPSTSTASYTANKTTLTAIPLGQSGVTARKLYRTVAGGSQLKLLATLSDNATTTSTDTTPDASLGANIPTSNTTLANVVNLSAIPLGGTGVTDRKVYRTAAGATQLKYVASLGDNTTTTYSDTMADGSLGANVPTGDTSGLTQPDGQINAGSTSLVVAGPGAFNSGGGWAVIGNGQQVVRYTGISGTSLTGVPASGAGAITATIAYNSTVTAAPALRGIPGSGAGAIVDPIKKGDPINLLVQADDTAAQAILAGLVGGDGVQETYLQDRRLSHTEALARAEAQLAQHNQAEVTISFKTRDPNTRAGRTVTAALPVPTDLAGSFKIQSVTITTFSPNVLPTYEARASSTRFSFEDLLRLQTH